MRKLIVLGLLAALIAVPATDAATRKAVKTKGAHGKQAHDATIRNSPPSKGNGYVVGNARLGATMDVLGNENGLDYGYIFGNFKHCGWVYAVNLNPTGKPPKGSCSAGANHHYTFRSFSNGERNCKPGTCGDGSNAHMDYQQPGCQASGFAGKAFANVNPFASPATPHDQYGTLKDEAYLKWRYTSKDGNWVMVHDRFVHSRAGYPASASDWYFTRRQCLRKG